MKNVVYVRGKVDNFYLKIEMKITIFQSRIFSKNRIVNLLVGTFNYIIKSMIGTLDKFLTIKLIDSITEINKNKKVNI